MIWFIIGILIGHYVIPEIKHFVSKLREEKK